MPLKIDEIRAMDQSSRRPLAEGGIPSTPETDRPAEGCEVDYARRRPRAKRVKRYGGWLGVNE